MVAREGDVRMSAWPGELKRSGEWVSVSWSGASASWGDWVGVYSPADADVTVTAPIKYKYADEVISHCTLGTQIEVLAHTLTFLTFQCAC